jgi:hypothetical protein
MGLCSLNGNSIFIRAVAQADIERLIDIHVQSLPNDVLPNLGRGTIIRYYSKILELQAEQNAALFGAYGDRGLVGFCCVTRRPVEVASLIGVDTIKNLLSMFFLRPALFFKALAQLWHAPSIPCSAFEIAYIAVEDSVRGMGVGGLLIGQCMAYGRESECKYIQTKTSNDRLCKHYLASYGGKIVNEFCVFQDVYRVIRWSV